MNRLIFILIQLAIFSSLNCQDFPATKPEKTGMSQERLDRIKPFMQKYVDENKLPGLITLVARHGKMVHFEKYGKMDEGKPMQFNTIFSIQSMTKPVISVAVMMLYEEGRFQLADPIAKYIPELKDVKVFSSVDKDGIHVVDQENPVTIWNLLTHTSGFTYGWFKNPVDSMYRAARLQEGTLKDMIEKLSRIPLQFQPGTQWHYGYSTNVLGYLVEVVSGKPLDQFLRERIFNPLKMDDTDFLVPQDKLDRFAALYDIRQGLKRIDKPEAKSFPKPPVFFNGGGGLVSTASDYLVFAQMMLNKGEYQGIRLLGSKTVEFMTRNHLSEELLPLMHDANPPMIMKGIGFGLGVSVVIDDAGSQILGSKGTYRWDGLYNTNFWIDPAEDLIAILMIQFSPYQYYPVNSEFQVLVYQALVE
jgi:CubicO group peptidase (beta-lactamase class C family)